MASVKLKDSKQIRAELEQGADPNEGNALHEAIREGATQSVYALVKHGADINGRDWRGTSTLEAVNECLRWSSSEETEKKALTIAAYLIKNGADPKAQDQHGRTILHNTKNERLIELLVQKGADPAAKNSSGETPYQHQYNRLKDINPRTGLRGIAHGAPVALAGVTILQVASTGRRVDARRCGLDRAATRAGQGSSVLTIHCCHSTSRARSVAKVPSIGLQLPGSGLTIKVAR